MRHARAVGARDYVIEHRCEFLSGTRGFAPQPVQGTVAGDRHDPSTGVIRHAVAGPGAQRFGEGLLDGVLGDGEVTRPTRECGHGRTPFAPKDAVQIGHSRRYQSPDTPSSRRSSTVVAGIIDATLMASSRSGVLIR